MFWVCPDFVQVIVESMEFRYIAEVLHHYPAS
ncbi:hypothetical protein SAMN05443246_2364 [Paenibacillus sp. GP183]|nr:hypothetical protein SAMN05443246_2364 [Paenibacillus sp. GP183]